MSKQKRLDLAAKINLDIKNNLKQNKIDIFCIYAEDRDTYIRKTAYLAVGKIFKIETKLRDFILRMLLELIHDKNYRIRQTVVYAAGEIGKVEFKEIKKILEKGIKDSNRSVKNAVTGALKQLGQKNIKPMLRFINNILEKTNDFDIKTRVIHGLELRGRSNPEDILNILKKFEMDKNKKFSSMIVHVLGQISYKKDCLEKVLNHIQNWENKGLVLEAIKEIVDVHDRYAKFSFYTKIQALEIINQYFNSYLKI